MTDNLRDKIISLAKARVAKEEAIIDAVIEAEIRASEQLDAMLTDAVTNWLNITGGRFNDNDTFAETFYFGSVYFVQTLIKMLSALDSRDAKDFVEKLQLAVADA
jgi:hypothetical protein